MTKLNHLDVSSVKPDHGTTCGFCWEAQKVKAEYRVWSKDWGMYISVCRKHARQMISVNKEVA